MILEFLSLDTVNFPLVNQLVVIFINLVAVVLAVLVIIRNTMGDRRTSVFIVMTALMLTWINFAYLARIAGVENEFWAEQFLRIAWVATPPFFAYVYLLTMHMLRREKKMVLLHNTIIFSSLALSAFTAFSNFIIKGISFSGSDLDIMYGAGFYPFLSVVSVYIVLTLIPVFTTKLEGYHRQRVRVVLIGVLIFYVANVVFNIALPAFFNVTHLYYFGDYSLIFLLGFTAYAIIRHRFFDIRVAIMRSISFLMLLAIFFALYWLILVLLVPRVSEVLGVPSSALYAFGALLIIVFERYGRSLLSRITNKFLFQQRANLRARLVEISRELSQTIDIQQINAMLLTRLSESLRTDKVIIYLQSADQKEFVPNSSWGKSTPKVSVGRKTHMLEYLEGSLGPVIKDELSLAREKVKSEDHDITTDVEQAMIWLDAAMIIPLHVDQKLIGFIVIGPKRSGQPYLQDDIEFSAALAPQAATALENARLYKESLEFGQKLQEEVKKATADLERANDQLRLLDKAKSEFLNIASHQLYTPLTAIRGYLSMLNEGDYGKIDDQKAPVFDILNKSTERLIDLIKNLLDISRIESGRLKLNLEMVDLSEMAHELVQDLLPNAMQKHLRLEFHTPTQEIPKVVADKERIRQVMLNFVDNAIKYTEKGKIDVYIERVNLELMFKVVDTGIGLKREETDRLFTKFTRVGEAQDFHTEGQGLGLYVARQIVREHHGEVEVQSKGHGMGSTFIMHFPLPNSPNSLKLGEEAEVIIKAASDE